jgi:hypothetical protein
MFAISVVSSASPASSAGQQVSIRHTSETSGDEIVAMITGLR